MKLFAYDIITRKYKRAIYFIYIFLFLILPLPSYSEEINISAEHLEFISSTKTYFAKGSVRVDYEDTKLLADEMHLDSITYDASAKGNFFYEDPETIITADRAEINLKSKLGIIYDGYIFYKRQNVHLHGGNIEKTGKKTFFINKASVTTCDADPPAWHVSGSSISVTQHENLSSWNTTFKVRKIPVFYTPYFWAPLTRERQTGFTFPLFGYSNTKGYYYKQGLFWAISENQDTTFHVDYYSEKGIAEGFDYRYILTPETNGEFWIYHIRDKILPQDLYEIKAYHNQELPHDISGYLKLHAVNQYNYYDIMGSTSAGRFGLSSWKTNPFGFSSDETLQKYLESDLHLTRPFSGGRTYFLMQGRQSLEGSSREIPQSFPEIAFIMNTESNDFVSYNMAFKTTNFWREKGQRGQRLDINPNIFLSYGRLVNITQRVGLRETAYFLNEPEHGINRMMFDLNTALTTSFYKKYDKFIHIIDPRLEYEYVPSVNHDEIPFFDSTDFIPHTSMIRYSLTNRMSGISPYSLQARARLSQSYSLLDIEKRFSPLLLEATFSKQGLSLNANASFDVRDKQFEETIASATVGNKKAYAGIGKNYRRTSELDQYTFEAGLIRPISIFRKSVPMDLNGKIWYDLNGGGVQMLRVNTSYKKQCWGVIASYIKTPDEYQILFGIELTGLGTFNLSGMTSDTFISDVNTLMY